MSRSTLPIRDSADGCELTVLARPRARRTEFAGIHNGALCIRVHAPPVDGKANKELVRFLAQEFAVPRSAVAVQKGATSRLKVVTVRGRTSTAVSRAIDAMQTGE